VKFKKILEYIPNTSKLLVCSLSFLIFLQICFLALKGSKFPVPETFLNFLINGNKTLKNIKISNVSYKFPNQLNIGTLSYKNNTTYKFKNVKYLLKDYPLTKTSILSNLTVSDFKLDIPYFDQEFKISDFSSTNIGNKFYISFSFFFENLKINFTGSTKTSSLNFILTSLNKRNRNNENLIKYFIDRIKEFKSNFNLSNFNIQFLAVFSLDQNLNFRIVQINSPTENSMINGINFSSNLNITDFKINNLYSKFEEINIQTPKSQLIFKDNYFSIDSKIKEKKSYQTLSFFKTKNIITKERLQVEYLDFHHTFLQMKIKPF
jgi:hypothetical protein